MESLTFYEYSTVTTLTVLPIGHVAPASSDDTALRIYNTSDIYQAQDVTVALSGDDAIQLWLSTDGDTFSPSITVGDIPPTALSPTFWLRRVTASTQPAGGCTASLTATPTAWTYPVDSSTSLIVPLETEDS